VIQLLNYSRRGGDALFYVKEPYKSARVVSPELASPAELQFAPQEAGGAELTVPRIPCMAPSSWRNRRLP